MTDEPKDLATLLDQCRELEARSPEYTEDRFDRRYVDSRGMKELVADVKRGASVFVSREAFRAIIAALESVRAADPIAERKQRDAEIAGLRADCAALRDGLRRLSGEAVSLIVAERERQQSTEGWTPAHDDTHTNGALAQAASCYASVKDPREEDWPWESHWNKRDKHGRIKQLVIAGALIVAEIERLQRRAAGQVCSECGGEGVVAIESDSLLSAGTRVLGKCRACNP